MIHYIMYVMMPIQRFPGPLHEKSYRFALSVIVFCQNLINIKKEFILSKQLMRSGTSIGANIEEAQQPQSRADFISKLSIALKEAYESRYWLRLIFDAGYSEMPAIENLVNQCEEIIGMLAKSVRTSKEHRQ